MQLSDHFTLAELTKSSTAERMGIDNEPGSEVIGKLTLVCENILEPVRNHYDIPFAPTVPSMLQARPLTLRFLVSATRKSHFGSGTTAGLTS
jgi:hypothetical protein